MNTAQPLPCRRSSRPSFIEVLEARIAPATFSWTGGNGNWNDQSHWLLNTMTPNSGVPGANDTAIFLSTSGSPIVTVTTDTSVAILFFAGSGTSPTINGLNSSVELTMFDSGDATRPTSIVLDSTGSATLNVNVAQGRQGLPVNLSVNSSTQGLTLNGVLSAGTVPVANHGGFMKTGAGTLTLAGSGANTFPDNTSDTAFVVTEGTLILKKAGAIAIPSNLKINGGSVFVGDSSLGNTAQQIADSATVTVGATGLLGLEQNETITKLAGSGRLNGAIRTLKLLSNSTFSGSFGSLVGGNLGIDLSGGIRFDLTGTQEDGLAGVVRIINGQLNVTGSYAPIAFTLDGLATLSGSGTVGSISSNGAGGSFSPGTGTIAVAGSGTGSGVGAINVSGTLSATSGRLFVDVDLGGVSTGGGNDLIHLGPDSSVVSASVQPVFHVASDLSFSAGQEFVIFQNDAAGIIAPLNNGAGGAYTEGAVIQTLAGGDYSLRIRYEGGDGNDVVLSAEPNYVAATAAIAMNGKSASFLQADGDTLVVKTNKGKFTAANFTYAGLPSTPGAGTLQLLDLSADIAAITGNSFKGASITTTVTKGANGDGLADIGYINAAGVDLKSVSVKGDLGRIDAGDAAFKTAGLGALSAYSMGVQGKNTQVNFAAPDRTNLTSTIVGKLGSLKLTLPVVDAAPSNAGKMLNTFLHVVGDQTSANYRFGSIGKISIGALSGFTGENSFGDAGTVGTLYAAGSILAEGKIGSVLVNDSIAGGGGAFSGTIFSRTSLGSITIGKAGAGNLTGGSGFDSGAIFAGSPDLTSGTLAGKLGAVKLKGILQGGSGLQSGTLYADSGLTTVKVGGNVIGAAGEDSGSIISGKGISSLSVGGDFSGNIRTLAGNVGSIKVTGSLKVGVISGPKGIFIAGTLGSLTAGSLDAEVGDTGFINVSGKFDSTGVAKAGTAIGKIKVTNDLNRWTITAGLGAQSINPYTSIGSISVGGNATNLAVLASVDRGADFQPGTADDAHFGNDTLPNVVSSIASITIAGQATNSVFEAEQVKALKIGGVKATLLSGKLNDLNVSVGTNKVNEI